jgi:hypothetical protein
MGLLSLPFIYAVVSFTVDCIVAQECGKLLKSISFDGYVYAYAMTKNLTCVLKV